MIDFTSALYLGFEHPSWALPAWPQLTLGKPAALDTLPGVDEAQTRLANLTGCESVSLGPSTFHLCWDLFRWLTTSNTEFYVFTGAYPTTQWGLDYAKARGVPVRTFGPGSMPSFKRGTLPVVMTDGYFPASGRAAPIVRLLAIVERFQGILVIDDTQALGIFGHGTSAHRPFGSGGGGSLQTLHLSSPRILLVSSLAKGFGVPLAMVAGAESLIGSFEESSQTRVHCSPPSAPVIAACLRALDLNSRIGDCVRDELAKRIRQFRSGLLKLGIASAVGLFPVQPLELPFGVSAQELHRYLASRGIRTVLQRTGPRGSAAIAFVVTARHRSFEIDRALLALSEGLAQTSRTAADGGGENAKLAGIRHSAYAIWSQKH